MREERFRIQCPEHFQVGDSGRFEKPSQDKDSDFVVDYAPPEMFEAGIVLQEMGTEGDTYCWSYVKKKYKLNTTNFLFLCNC